MRMKLFAIIILLLLMPEKHSFGQNIDLIRISFPIAHDSVENKINRNLNESETPFLIALSYFPELNETMIKFREQRIRNTMNVRPSLGSVLFRSKLNQRYIIRINNTTRADKITPDKVPHAALVGLYGHELSHIIDYETKNKLQIIFTGISYSTKKGKERLEKKIDRITVERGLGWQLYYWSDFVLNNSDASKKYKTFKKTIYLKPTEIEELIKANSYYNNLQFQNPVQF